ncbi:MAG TPA: hypothetical protein PK157_22275 [Bryobacteraceae bacterium]|nr:hypothetical protein [Bryobacteraceae bacterium]
MPVRLSIPLSTGAAVHVGLARLLRDQNVEEAVAEALRDYDRAVTSRGLQVDANEAVEYAYAEQRALVEAQIRAYAHYRLKGLLEEFEVLEIEREDTVPLAAEVDGRPLVWMSRADALLLNRAMNVLEVMSFKTLASWDERQEAAANHDMQGLSEAYAIEHRLKQQDKLPKEVYAIRMEFLLKGERRRSSDGIWKTESPLIRAYKRVNPWPAEPDYCWSYYWYCSAPHKVRKSKWYPTGECPGDGRKHTISSDFEPVRVWQEDSLGGVKGWIDSLARGVIQPEAGDALAQQFVLPVPYFRQPEDMKRWYRQVSSQESRVKRDVRFVQSASSHEKFEARLDQCFPMHTRSCDWPSKCDFQDICFNRCPRKEELPELYMWRTPHHKPELVQLRKEEQVRRGS